MKLTKREEQMLSLIATGMTTTQIANYIGISERTVHTHLSRVYNKLGVQNRAAAMITFMEMIENGVLEMF